MVILSQSPQAGIVSTLVLFVPLVQICLRPADGDILSIPPLCAGWFST
jgi:hypothetical protein